jgi:leucine-rich repeat/coiled-coil domain-containing protein 1
METTTTTTTTTTRPLSGGGERRLGLKDDVDDDDQRRATSTLTTSTDGELAVYGERVESLRGLMKTLEGFERLRTLRVHACGLRDMDVEVLARCGALEELDLSSNDVTRARGLSGLKKLRTLSLASNALESCDGLNEAVPMLERVNLSNNRIKSLSGLNRTDGAEWSIRALDVRGNALESFHAVRALGTLTKLESLRCKTEAESVLGEETNLICGVPTYRTTVASIVPWLNHLDGAVVSIETSTRAMSRTLSRTAPPTQIGSMTPPNAELISRTPSKPRAVVGLTPVERDDSNADAAVVVSRAVQVNVGDSQRSIDFDQVLRVREEATQTEIEPELAAVEMQHKEIQVDDDGEDFEDSVRNRVEVEKLRADLNVAEETISRMVVNDVGACERIQELESTLQAVRIESAENLAQLKAMYEEEQNVMLNECVQEARKESSAYVSVVEENSRLIEQAHALETEDRKLRETLALAKQNLEKQTSQTEALTKALEDATESRRQAELMSDELARVVEDQRLKFNETKAQLNQHQSDVISLTNELEKAQMFIEKLSSEHENVEDTLVAIEKAERAAVTREAKARARERFAEQLIVDVEQLQSQLQTSAEGLAVKDNMIQHQGELIKSLRDEAIRLREEKSEASESSELLVLKGEAQVNALTEECRVLVDQVEGLELNVNDLQAALRDAQVDHAGYEHAIKNAKNAVSERDDIIVALEGQVSHLTETLASRDTVEQATIQELRNQMADLSEQLEIAREKASKWESRAAASQEESDALVREAYRKVDETEMEMRGLLLEMAEERSSNKERMEKIARLIHYDTLASVDHGLPM